MAKYEEYIWNNDPLPLPFPFYFYKFEYYDLTSKQNRVCAVVTPEKKIRLFIKSYNDKIIGIIKLDWANYRFSDSSNEITLEEIEIKDIKKFLRFPSLDSFDDMYEMQFNNNNREYYMNENMYVQILKQCGVEL